MGFLVQAVLLDDNIETITDSIKTDKYDDTLDLLMKRHKSSSKYLYNVRDIDNQRILISTTNNKYYI